MLYIATLLFFPQYFQFLGSKKFISRFYGIFRKKNNRNIAKMSKNPIFGPPYIGQNWKISEFFFFATFYGPRRHHSRNRNIWIGPEGRYFLRRKLKKLKIHRKISLKIPNIAIFQRPVENNLDKIEYSI